MSEKNQGKTIFPPRDPWSHKGDFGKVVVIGGSKKYHGSPIFAAMAAYRVGADLVTIIAPERAAHAAACYAPDLITIALEGDFITSAHLPIILSEVEEADAVVIGGGMGREKATFEAVDKLLDEVTNPLVLDADALRALAAKLWAGPGEDKVIREQFVSKKVILTPHAGELSALLNRKDQDPACADRFPNLEERKKVTQNLATKLGCVVLFKGYVDVIADSKQVETNETGSPHMTVGGTGDLLAGVCGAFLARGLEPFEAALKAAWINGKAGELAAADSGESLIASDILNFYPRLLQVK
jgi:hydroxyethylthiazole kinase-like uncharacterized protein yjeF